MAATNFDPNSTIINRIGEPGSPIRAVKDKVVRAELGRMLKDLASKAAPEILLRAYLAIGKPPAAQLISERALRLALTPEDCANYLQRLTVRRTTIDANAPLTAISKLLGSHRDFEKERVLRQLSRCVSSWERLAIKGSSLTSSSVRALRAVLVPLLYAVRRDGTSKQGRKQEHLLSQMVVFTVRSSPAVNRDDLEDTLLFLTAVQDSIHHQIGNDYDEDPGFRRAYDELVQNIQKQLSKSARENDVAEFLKGARTLLRLNLAKRTARDWIQQLWDNRAEYSFELQSGTAELLGISTQIQKQPELTGQSEGSVETLQLASALSRSWAAADDSHQAREAFEELSAVLKSFFGIEFKGATGEIVPYNPYVHEIVSADAKSSSLVRVVRPRVELNQGSRSVVLLKASVIPMEGESNR